MGVAAVALIAALATALMRRDSSENTAGGSTQDTLLVCIQDGHSFTVSPTEYAEQLRSSSVATGSPDESRGQIPKLKCPKCGQAAAVIAARCPKDQTPVPSVGKDGQPPRCPRCGGNPFE